MASTNKTKNLQLPNFVGKDKVKMADFNEAFTKLDQAVERYIKSIVIDKGKLKITLYNETSQEYTVSQNATNEIAGVVTLAQIQTMIDKKQIVIKESAKGVKGIIDFETVIKLIDDNVPNASESIQGKISEARVKQMIDEKVPIASLKIQGKISEDRIKEIIETTLQFATLESTLIALKTK